MSISETIRGARRRAGLTQEQLAAKVCVTRQAVSRWETGESEPGIDMRKLLASVLGVPVASLLDLPDAPACQRVSVEHPMTKDDHLLFIAAVGDDLVRIKRLYPEGEARAEFWMQGPCKVYAYGNGCGLVEL